MLSDRLQAELDRRLAEIADERSDEPWRVLPRADRIALLLLVLGSLIGVYLLQGL